MLFFLILDFMNDVDMKSINEQPKVSMSQISSIEPISVKPPTPVSVTTVLNQPTTNKINSPIVLKPISLVKGAQDIKGTKITPHIKIGKNIFAIIQNPKQVTSQINQSINSQTVKSENVQRVNIKLPTLKNTVKPPVHITNKQDERPQFQLKDEDEYLDLGGSRGVSKVIDAIMYFLKN